MTRSILIIADSLFVLVIISMNYSDGGFNRSPLFLKFLVVIAFAICIIRHINYYKHTKKIY
jgi:hypothetical protein